MSDFQPPFGGGFGPPSHGSNPDPGDGEGEAHGADDPGSPGVSGAMPTEPPSPGGSGGDDSASGLSDTDADADAVLAEAASIVEADLAAILAERDDYLSALRRVQADFENFRKQNIKRNTELVERAGEELINKLLPVLDACEGAMQHGATDVEPIASSLFATLEKEGLARIPAADEPFDPTVHEAVMHEPSDDGREPTVVEVLRTGYLWKGRVLRPALVKVKG